MFIFIYKRKNVFHPPFNFITELAHTNTGIELIVRFGFIKQILPLISNDDYSIKLKKSAFWILAKMIKFDKTNILNNKYKVLELIHLTYLSTNDYSLKGSISYIFSFLSTNQEIKNELIKLGWTYFKNRDIAFQRLECMLNSNSQKDPGKLSLSVSSSNDSMVNKYLELSPTNEEYYNQFCLLLNTITYKQAYTKLKDQHKIDNQSFSNPKLLVKIINLLSNYRYQQQLRQFIFSIIESGISNIFIMKEMSKILDSLGKDFI